MKRILLLMAATAVGVSAAAQYTLDSCQRLARENYPLIRQYGIVEQTEEYSLKNASMAYVPQLSLSGQATYQSDVVSFPDAFQEMFRMMTGEEMEGIRPDQYKFMLSLNQTIWDGGHTKSRKEMARAEKEVAVQTAETEMHALRGRVNQIYFGILMLTAQLEQNSLVQSTLENNRNTVAAYVANGTAMESDLNHIRAELLANSQRRAQIESSLKAYRMMLSLMTGVEMGEGATFAKPEVPREETMMPVDVRRPELDLFNAQTAQLEAQRRALNAAVTPKLGLFAQGWYGNPGLDMFADMMEYKWGFNGIAGVTIGTRKGKDIVPDQSLALSALLDRSRFACVDLDYAQAIGYLRKETVVVPDGTPKGFVLFTYKDTPIGFGKNIGNRVNNLYPQEWKIKSRHIPEQKEFIHKENETIS